MWSLLPSISIPEIGGGSHLPRRRHSISAAPCGIVLVLTCKHVEAQLHEHSRGYLGLAELFLCVQERRK